MADYPVPPGIQFSQLTQLGNLCVQTIQRSFSSSSISGTTVVSVTFSPDLTSNEILLLSAAADIVNASHNFLVLPDWSTFTAQQASDFINSNILSGQTQAQLDALINTNIANITVANVAQINTALAGIRSAFSLVASGIISIRTILQALAKAIVFLRNLVVH